MKKHYKSLMWESYDLPRVLEERGVLDKDKLPGFHYRDDALRLWQIIKEYIADILNIYYHSDKDVEKVSLSLLSILVMGALVKFSAVVGTEWDIKLEKCMHVLQLSYPRARGNLACCCPA